MEIAQLAATETFSSYWLIEVIYQFGYEGRVHDVTFIGDDRLVFMVSGKAAPPCRLNSIEQSNNLKSLT